ncbi:hypothetical protein JMJ58_05600 [Haloterrigena salifodinae]|uniref:Uncharacterized protein n=1 Tax=Haloterrigena salifodinae TaxID=2675099 RepID=A0A8T8E3C7_9EURY|nr:hypothetical protein [Haloterrigena salifodinae]QRV16364.1 hypothetical protein JMJ58_05600 [Haloterrigena salifodinae]
MVLDLLLDLAAAVSDRPDGRTRLQQVCSYLGLLGLLFGAWIAVSSEPAVGFGLAVAGSGLWLYGAYVCD